MMQRALGRFAYLSFGLGRPRPTLMMGMLLASVLATPALMAASITVNTATDDFGAVTSNCSLREAIRSANSNADFGGCTHSGTYGTDGISLPGLAPGVFFNLTRVGTDDTNLDGDLDISGNLTITGAGVASSAIRSNFSAANSDRFRVFHVLSGTVTLIDLTLRDGLEDGSVAGGGLRTEPNTSTTLTRVNVFQNNAGGNGGGILNQGSMAINNSIIRANLANQSGALTRGGGGVFNADGASMTINDSQILDNIVDDGSVTAFGGGIYSGAGSVLFVDNSVIDGNRADGRALVATNDALGQGGGIWTQGNLSLEQSTVSNNTAIGEFARGGGIHTEGQTLDIDRSLIFANLAESRTQAFSGGGGLSVGANSDDNVIRDSVISSNRTDGNGLCRGGGIYGDSGFLILRSSIANNQAICNDGDGGGVSFSGNGEIVNSTVINNQANNDGGGIHVINSSGSVVKIRSSTVVQNTANADGNAAGFGGGVAVQAGFADLGNSVLAGNINSNNSVDCSGNLSSVGNNLIQTASFCTFGTQSSDQLNINALLAAAANNGGPIAGSSLGVIAGVLTRTPLPSSTLIDRGDASGCKDHTNQVLTTDQVGRARAIDGPDPDTIARCDIGAVEYQDTLFAGGFEGPA